MSLQHTRWPPTVMKIASLGPSYRQGNFVVSHDIAATSVLPCKSPLRSLYVLLFLAYAPSRVSSQPYKKQIAIVGATPGYVYMLERPVDENPSEPSAAPVLGHRGAFRPNSGYCCPIRVCRLLLKK